MKPIKSILIIFTSLFLLSASAYGSLYVSISGGTASHPAADDDPNAIDISGSALGATLGYRWGFIAPELWFKSTSADGSSTQLGTGFTVQTEIKDIMKGAGLRFFFLHFASARFGAVVHDFDVNFIINGVDSSALLQNALPNDASVYLGAGIQIPFGRFEIFGDWTRHASASPDTANGANGGGGTTIETIELGLRLYF